MMGQSTPSAGLQVTKFGEAVSTLKGSAATQRNLSKLEKWFGSNIVKFSRSKWQVLHLGRNNAMHHYMGPDQMNDPQKSPPTYVSLPFQVFSYVRYVSPTIKTSAI